MSLTRVFNLIQETLPRLCPVAPRLKCLPCGLKMEGQYCFNNWNINQNSSLLDICRIVSDFEHVDDDNASEAERLQSGGCSGCWCRPGTMRARTRHCSAWACRDCIRLRRPVGTSVRTSTSPAWQGLCRASIRERLNECSGGRSILDNITLLPLPQKLIQFLSFSDEFNFDTWWWLWFVCSSTLIAF